MRLSPISKLVEMCHANLSNTHREYFSGRGYSAGALESFGIGTFSLGLVVSTSDCNELISLKIMHASRVGHRSYYSEFSDRIIIPVHDAYGQPVGITGRLIVEDPNRGKYYNSDYPKASTLFNLHRAKQEILRAGYAVVVEGNLDVVAMWDAGIKNVVACTGAFITPKQVRKLLRYTNKILVATDNDNAGHASYIKFLKTSAYYIENGELSPIRIIPPFGLKDPDDFIRKYGSKTCREWVSAGARHLMDVGGEGNPMGFKGVWNGCEKEKG